MRCSLKLEQLDARDVPAVLYVAPIGSDLNAGTSAAPWLTLQDRKSVV